MRFQLGIVLATPAALAHLEAHHTTAIALLTEHVNGRWGDTSAADQVVNEHAIPRGERIVSRYNVGTTPLLAITEADRSSTTILLASEY